MLVYATISVLNLVISASYAQAPSPLTQAQIDAYNPYTYFAAAAFCKEDALDEWKCGANCNANSGFKVTLTNRVDETPRWFIGYAAKQKEIIVSYMDIDPTDLPKLFTESQVVLEKPDTGLFPGLASDVMAERGFLSVHKRSALPILQAVRTTLNQHPTAGVTLTGLGTGGALAQLGLLRLHLISEEFPRNLKLKSITYGVPQVGNGVFADLYSSLDFTHINNKQDPVPTLPGAGYRGVTGEIHIDSNGHWQKCPGQDNPNALCARGAVAKSPYGNLNDHNGPFNDILIQC